MARVEGGDECSESVYPHVERPSKLCARFSDTAGNKVDAGFVLPGSQTWARILLHLPWGLSSKGEERNAHGVPELRTWSGHPT